jgi:CheY-like chemotaxis protein
MMPKMNGWEFIKKFQNYQKFQDIPIIVISAFSSELRGLLPDAVVSKPINLDQLLSVVEALLSKARQ